MIDFIKRLRYKLNLEIAKKTIAQPAGSMFLFQSRKEKLPKKETTNMSRKIAKQIVPLAYDIRGLAEASGRGRTTIYEDIAAGRLIVRKAGGKNIILHDDAVAWLEALPIREPSRSALGAAASG